MLAGTYSRPARATCRALDRERHRLSRPATTMQDIAPQRGDSMRATPLRAARTILAAALVAIGAFAIDGSVAAPNPRASERALNNENANKKVDRSEGMLIVNGRIHTMDGSDRIVEEVLIKNGRFVEMGRNLPRNEKVPVVDVGGRTVIPGIIDAHNHIVLVGNRPGWHTGMEHVFTIADAVAAYQARAANVPPGEFVTTIGPIAAMQFPEQRLPNLSELDAVPRPVYIQAAQGGASTNSAGKAWLQARGVTVADNGTVGGGASGTTLALRLLREQLLTPATRQRSATDALQYYNMLGITTHRDAGAFHSEAPSGGIANENVYTMHRPFLALDRAKDLPARLRIDFLHQDAANDITLPTLTDRLRNAFPFFGNDWMRTGGIGEFTGGGVAGLRAIAANGWRGEDHTLSLNAFNQQVLDREIVNAEIPLNGLRWILSHVPQTTDNLVNRWKAMGGGLLVGWGPTRTRAAGAAAIGPVYRTLFDNGIPLGYHSDGGDITVINPWLNFYTMITGRNLRGDLVNDNQVLTRRETMWLATAANKWFIWEDDVGSIEPGNHADLVVLDRDFFSIPDAEIPRVRSVLTVIGGKVKHDAGAVRVPKLD
jgi:predicted amidohydrolase YtcJ